MSKQKVLAKATSIVLSLLILLTVFPFKVSATNTVTVTPAANTDVISANANDTGTRVRSEEGNGLNTIVIDNGDGTHTMNLYDHPVKFVNSNGDVEDISLEIISGSDGSYITKANSIQTVFPKKLSDGISLSSEGINIKLIPSLITTQPSEETSVINSVSNDSNVTKLNDETVTYYFNNKTTLEYSLTYTGFKEEIVVSEYTVKRSITSFLKPEA